MAAAAEALRIANKRFLAVAAEVKKQRAWLREFEVKLSDKAAAVVERRTPWRQSTPRARKGSSRAACNS
eukprot:2325921-Pyramimonas_sp.AAC.1